MPSSIDIKIVRRILRENPFQYSYDELLEVADLLNELKLLLMEEFE